MIENIDKRIDTLEKVITTQNNILANFIKGVTKCLSDIKDDIKVTDSWFKEFHKLALQEYAAGPRRKVYSFVFVRGREVQVFMVAKNTYEEAYEQAKRMLSDIPGVDWKLETFQSLEVPIQGTDLKETTTIMAFDKPLDAYCNELLLARDRFCRNTTEKKVVDNIIKNIKNSYAKQHSARVS